MKIRVKALVTAIALIAVLSGCGNRGSHESPSPSPSSPAPTESQTPAPSSTSNKTLLQEFRTKALANAPADELLHSMNGMLEEVEPAEADEFIRIMESYYEKNLAAEEQKLQAEKVQQQLLKLDWPFTEDQIASIEDESVRQLVEQTLAGGYKLDTAEGYVFPVVDYSKLLSYSDNLTASMNAYLSLMAMESDDRSARDASLVISWDELSRRTLAAESYVMTFPDSPERPKAEERFLQYLRFYLIGLDNTPIFGGDYKILPELKSHLEQTAASHPGTITGQLTKELLEILNITGDAVAEKNKNGDEVDVPEFKVFRDTLESKAVARLPVGKS